jgi:hypothetical protein
MSITFSRKFLQHSHVLPTHSHITRHFYVTKANHNTIMGNPMCLKIYGWADCVGLSWCVQNGISFLCTNLAYTSKLDPKSSSSFFIYWDMISTNVSPGGIPRDIYILVYSFFYSSCCVSLRLCNAQRCNYSNPNAVTICNAGGDVANIW